MATTVQKLSKMSVPLTDEFMVRGDVYEACFSIEGLTGMKAWEAFVEIYSLKRVDGESITPKEERVVKHEIAEQCRVHNFSFKDREYQEEYKSEMRSDESRGN